MTYKYIKDIIKNNSGLLRRKTYTPEGIIFGAYKDISYDICFARMPSKLNHQTTPELFYLLYVDIDAAIFDYTALIKELNKIFNDYFDIKMYKTGRSSIRLLYIKEKKEFYAPVIKLSAYILLGVLLRTIDSEFFTRLSSKKDDKFPLTDWITVITYLYNVSNVPYHGINDNLNTISHSISYIKKEDRYNLVALYVTTYVNNLISLFGSGFDYKKHIIKNKIVIPKPHIGYSFRGLNIRQTKCFQTMMEIRHVYKR